MDNPMRVVFLDALRTINQPHPEYRPGQPAEEGWSQLAEIVAAVKIVEEHKPA